MGSSRTGITIFVELLHRTKHVSGSDPRRRLVSHNAEDRLAQEEEGNEEFVGLSGSRKWEE